jgi:hypothetical protein
MTQAYGAVQHVVVAGADVGLARERGGRRVPPWFTALTALGGCWRHRQTRRSTRPLPLLSPSALSVRLRPLPAPSAAMEVRARMPSPRTARTQTARPWCSARGLHTAQTPAGARCFAPRGYAMCLRALVSTADVPAASKAGCPASRCGPHAPRSHTHEAVANAPPALPACRTASPRGTASLASWAAWWCVPVLGGRTALCTIMEGDTCAALRRFVLCASTTSSSGSVTLVSVP